MLRRRSPPKSGGADRIELCDNLAVGGTTPSAGTIAESCRRLSIPVHVLIRPRAGDFVYSEPEIAVMRHDIEVAKTLGAAGVVLGVLTREAAQSTATRPRSSSHLARPLCVTFHKAFDQTREPLEALDTLIDLGVERVLTSGGRPTALEGIETLAKLVDHAGEKITVMAGGRLSISQPGNRHSSSPGDRGPPRLRRQPDDRRVNTGPLLDGFDTRSQTMRAVAMTFVAANRSSPSPGIAR